MPSLSVLIYKIICIAAFITSPIVPPTAAFVINSPNALTPQISVNHPISSLASKVIYESPSMSNIYKEYLVTSKPLTLHKYTNGMKKKMKKTKKDSKIYFIPMPPMPYRFIPGVGYDYQPMKINPIMQEAPTKKQEPNIIPAESISYGFRLPLAQGHIKIATTTTTTSRPPTAHKQHTMSHHTANAAMTTAAPFLKDSKIMRLNFNNKRFNGRPIRLQVAHALPKNHLTPENLKSKFYIDKSLIY